MGKKFAALWTSKWYFKGVFPHVGGERWFGVDDFRAEIARIRGFLGVDEGHVLGHVFFKFEKFWTNWAQMGSRGLVRGHVTVEFALEWEMKRTNGTNGVV